MANTLSNKSDTDKIILDGIEKVRLNFIYGHVVPKQIREFKNGRMITSCYSIQYDKDGAEIGRTKPLKISSVGYDNGAPFTENEYNRVTRKEFDKPSLFSEFKNFFRWG